MTYSIKAEVAMEIISMCIVIAKKENDIQQYNIFSEEKEQIYLGNETVIEKVINEYGNYFKKRMVQYYGY